MSVNDTYELTLWEGDYGLPSVDINSLILYSYVKFLKNDCIVRYCTNPLFNTIPGLCIKNVNTRKSVRVSNFACKWMNHQLEDIPNIDKNLTALQQTESRIYYMYLKEQLLPSVWETFWANEQNYTELTRRWYRSAMPFPLNLTWPWWQRRIVLSHLASLVAEDDTDQLPTIMLDKGKACLDNLASKLNDHEYFLGTDRPYTLDVMVFAHLAVLLLAPLPCSPLQLYAKQHENLVKHTHRMLQMFPQVKLKYKYVDKNVEQDNELKSNPGMFLMAILCAASTMIGYGMIIGVIKTSRS